MSWSSAPGWQFLVYAALMMVPVAAMLLPILFTTSVAPASNKVYVSEGELRLGDVRPSMLTREGKYYRLLCPPLKNDRYGHWCFVDDIWKKRGTKITVRHGEPTTRGIDRFEVCEIKDANGESLLRSISNVSCRNR